MAGKNKLPPNVPTVEVLLDRPRRIAFTLGAMRRIKQVTGHSVTDEKAELTDYIGAYIWAMLVEEDRTNTEITVSLDGGEKWTTVRTNLTPENVEDMIYPGNLNEIIAAFNAVVGQSTPEGKVEAVPVEVSPQS